MKPNDWILTGSAAILLALLAGASTDLLARQRAGSVATPDSHAAVSPYQQTLTFNGTDYHLRWTDRKEHIIFLEYTPDGQEDLSSWRDMLTVQIHPQIRGEEPMASFANNLLTGYQQNGAVILDTRSTPRTETREARHYIVAALSAENVVESNIVQMRLHDDQAMTVIVAHRFYGDGRIDAASQWITGNAAAIMQALMSWNPRITY